MTRRIDDPFAEMDQALLVLVSLTKRVWLGIKANAQK